MWRSFLLRPEPGAVPRSVEKFRSYTESWRRCAEQEPTANFQVWASGEEPPSHSVPPHLVAKAAAAIDQEGFARLHELLLDAYFTQNRNITNVEVLKELWATAGLPDERFGEWEDPRYFAQVFEEHNEAVVNGASGVPAVRVETPGEESFGLVMGAQPVEAYRKWLVKLAGT